MLHFDDIVFGPIHSRRLGSSLGVNILPSKGKLCNFDCVYCECGWNQPIVHPILPTRDEIKTALESKLSAMAVKGDALDVITFSGNGEPTLHPDFLPIIQDTCALRDRYYPQAKVSVLSNSTFIHKPDVFEALNKVDNNILKLDTIDAIYINKVDRPACPYNLPEIIENLKAFNGHVIIQTMFMKGEHMGEDLDNTGEQYVTPWIEAFVNARKWVEANK